MIRTKIAFETIKEEEVEKEVTEITENLIPDLEEVTVGT